MLLRFDSSTFAATFLLGHLCCSTLGTRVLCCYVSTQALLLLRFYSATCAAQHLTHVSYAAAFLLKHLWCYVFTQPLVLLSTWHMCLMLLPFYSITCAATLLLSHLCCSKPTHAIYSCLFSHPPELGIVAKHVCLCF